MCRFRSLGRVVVSSSKALELELSLLEGEDSSAGRADDGLGLAKPKRGFSLAGVVFP